MKSILAILFAACVQLATPIAHADEQRIAIVASARSDIMSISAKEVRRAYLGASIVLEGVEINPLINQSDKLAVEVFLQKVLFMSDEAYERQLLARTFRGGSRPKAYEDFTALLAALRKDSSAISFMLYETAKNTPEIRIIGSL